MLINLVWGHFWSGPQDRGSGAILSPVGNLNISKARDWFLSTFHKRDIVCHCETCCLKVFLAPPDILVEFWGHYNPNLSFHGEPERAKMAAKPPLFASLLKSEKVSALAFVRPKGKPKSHTKPTIWGIFYPHHILFPQRVNFSCKTSILLQKEYVISIKASTTLFMWK